jgi:acyl-coenzyme A thioesterase PaaI-like protein
MRPAELLEKDGFARRLGARLIEASEGSLVIEMDLGADHFDRLGQVASGVIFSLADCAMSLISNQGRAEVAVATHLTRSGPGTGAKALRVGIAAASEGDGRATTWHAAVLADGAPVATFTGTTLAVGGA